MAEPLAQVIEESFTSEIVNVAKQAGIAALASAAAQTIEDISGKADQGDYTISLQTVQVEMLENLDLQQIEVRSTGRGWKAIAL